MRVALFCHSLRSDWNHGNAHFLRGIVTELAARGHGVTAYEPQGAWSAANLVENEGTDALNGFRAIYPDLNIQVYDTHTLLGDGSAPAPTIPATPRSSKAGLASAPSVPEPHLEHFLDGVDLAIVHEWNEPALVAAIGRVRARTRGLRVLFHDTHHRSVTAQGEMARYDLTHYDGVLAFGESIRARYEAAGWEGRAWTWHEAADTRVFYPRVFGEKEGDLVWIGNWGDEERSAELRAFLIDPVRELNLRARVYGVRYPAHAQAELGAAGIEYEGWLPNYQAPEVFSHFHMTVHVPRRPYAHALPGVPTIRVFEALACGIPLISAPWIDSENLFGDGCFLRVSNGEEAKQAMRLLREDRALASELSARGLDVICKRHTCAHRVNELMEIWHEIKPGVMAEACHAEAMR